jgi:transcriptional antiterminator RfaH
MSQLFISTESTPNDTALTDRWYLAYTKPRQEQIALSNLELQHFKAYLPLYKKFKPSALGPVALFEPMFPRYIFFRPVEPGQSISTVRSTKGITTIVRFGFEPAVMSDALVQCIRQIEQDRSQASLQEISNLKAGQAVRLQHTALCGVEGLIQSVSSKRVAVLLEILGRPAVVQVEHHQVAVQS